MDGWTILYGTLTLWVVLLSMWTRCPGTLRAAGFILTCWMIYNVMQRSLSPHELAATACYIDMLGVLFGLHLNGRLGRRRHYPYVRWTWVFIGAHVADMAVHLWMLFAPFYVNLIYYSALNGLYVVILGSITAPSIGHLRRKRQHQKGRPVPATTGCEMRRGYCRRCGPRGLVCTVTGRATPRL